MLLLILTTTVLLLAMGLWRTLQQFPKIAPHALILTALILGLVLLVSGWWMQQAPNVVMSSAPEGQAYHHTDYIVVRGKHIAYISYSYLGVAVVLAAVQSCDQGWVMAVLPWGFWIFALGSLVMVLLPAFPALPVPRRYVDYPEWGRINQRIVFVAGLLACVGAAVMVTSLVAAVIQRRLRSGR